MILLPVRSGSIGHSPRKTARSKLRLLPLLQRLTEMSEIVMFNAGTTYPVAFDSVPQKALWRYASERTAYMGYYRVYVYDFGLNCRFETMKKTRNVLV